VRSVSQYDTELVQTARAATNLAVPSSTAFAPQPMPNSLSYEEIHALDLPDNDKVAQEVNKLWKAASFGRA